MEDASKDVNGGSRGIEAVEGSGSSWVSVVEAQVLVQILAMAPEFNEKIAVLIRLPMSAVSISDWEATRRVVEAQDAVNPSLSVSQPINCIKLPPSHKDPCKESPLEESFRSSQLLNQVWSPSKRLAFSKLQNLTVEGKDWDYTPRELRERSLFDRIAKYGEEFWDARQKAGFAIVGHESSTGNPQAGKRFICKIFRPGQDEEDDQNSEIFPNAHMSRNHEQNRCGGETKIKATLSGNVVSEYGLSRELPPYNPQDDNQITRLTAIFQKCIEDSLQLLLEPIASVLQSHGEVARKQREGFLAKEEKKLAQRREKIQRLKRARAGRFQPSRRASSAKSAQLRKGQGHRLTFPPTQ